MFHCGMKYRSKKKPEAGLVDTPSNRFSGLGEVRSQLFKHIGTSTGAGYGSVPVLCNANTGSSKYKGHRCGNIERPGSVSSGTAGIQQWRAVIMNGNLQ
jgi:hypothetical protein